MTSLRERLEALGFTLAHTGGNCTAFVDAGWSQDGQPHRMITVAEEPAAPESLDDEVVLCRYQDRDDDGTELFTGTGAELLTFLGAAS